MHFFTLQEIKQARDFEFFSLKEEKPLSEHIPIGAFDFFLETTDGKKIGFEILTRPSKGKLKRKLEIYFHNVDEFVFVLPSNSLKFYQKQSKKGLHVITAQKKFPKEFSSKKLKVWLFDLETKQFTKKDTFNKIFNVEP